MLTEENILEVNDLVASFDTEAGRIRAVDRVSFKVGKGRTLGVVGESGCGKSVTALSIMRLLPNPAGKIEQGEIRFKGKDIVKLPAEEMQKIRGRKISMIFQEPMTALNPVHRIGRQIGEIFRLHYSGMNNAEIIKESIKLLDRIGMPDPEKRIHEYPHQISGGMRQRVMIAMALACRPDMLIADEPTTALDVTIQAQILDLIHELQQDTNMSVVFITHDLGVIAEICDDVVVMYAGKVVENASVIEIFESPKHPYTQGLLASIPKLETKRKSRLSIIEGRVPSLDELPKGCRFSNRCPYVMDICKTESPPLIEIDGNHAASCYLLADVEGKHDKR